jgi:hypothetical protein
MPPVARRSDDRPTEPSAEFLLPNLPAIPRAARVPVFPEEWAELVDEIREASERRFRETTQSFRPAPVLRQSYATLCERVGRQRQPA